MAADASVKLVPDPNSPNIGNGDTGGAAGEPYRVLADRFEIRGVVAEGAFGLVQRAFDRERQELVAIKSVRYDRPEDVRLLKREFRILKDISHTNLLPLHHLACHGAEWFFSMALVEGITIEEAVTDLRATEDYRAVAFIFRGIADGLAHLHSHGVIHRDIKPSNVVVTDGLHPVLLDFGLSTRLSLEASRRSRAGTFTGSTAYAAPEQLFGDEVSPASDWFGVGMLLYQALTGVRPRREDLDLAVDTGRPLGLGVPDALSELTWRLLRPVPERRPTYKDVVRLLTSVTQSVSVPKVRLGPTRIVGRDSELELLVACRESLRNETLVVEVVGGHGQGKTHLVEGFCRDRERRGDLVIRSACRPDELIPYNAVDGLVDDVIRFLSGMPLGFVHAVLPSNLGLLVAMFPGLAELRHTPVEPVKIIDGEQAESAAAAFADFLGTIATRRPLCLFIDDIHWADRDSVRLLSALQQQTSAGIMVIATSQPGTSLRQVGLPVNATLSVEPMYGEDAEAYAVELTRRLDLDLAKARAAVADCGGHPYLSELVAIGLAEPGITTPKGATLQGVLGAQLHSLTSAQSELVALLSLTHAPLAVTALEAALPHLAPLEPIRDTLTRLQLAGLVGHRDRPALAILHKPVRKLVLESLSETPENTQRLHNLIIDVLDHDPDADPLARIHHLKAAKRDEEARELALDAAGRAEQSLAFHTAAKLLRLSLDSGDTTSRPQTMWRLSAMLVNAGRAAEAGHVAIATARLNDAAEVSDKALVTSQLAYGASQLLRGGVREEGVAVAEEVVRRVGLRWRKTKGSTIASLLWQRAATTILPRRSPKTPGKDTKRQLDMLWDVSSGLSFYDSLRAFELQARHARMALRAGDERHQALALATQAMVLTFENGNRREAAAIHLLARANSCAARLDDPAVEAHLRLMHVLVMYSGWHFEAVAREGWAGFEYCRDNCRSSSWERAGLIWIAATAQAKLGQFSELRVRVAQAIREADRLGDVYLATMVRLGQPAMGRLTAGDAEAVLEEAATARAVGGRSGFLDYLHAYATVRAHLYLDDIDRAEVEFWDAKRAVAAGGMMRSPLIRLEMLDMQARVALAKGAADPDSQAWRLELKKALRALRRVPHPAAAPTASFMQGQCAVLDRSPDEAAMSFALATGGFEAVGQPLEAGLATHLGRWVRRPDEPNRALGYLKGRGVASPTKFLRTIAPVVRP